MDVFNSQFYDSSISSDSSQTVPANSATSTNPPTTKKPQTFIDSIKAFLNTKTGTIIVFAAAMSIGAAFKDLVSNITLNIVQPLIIKLLLATNLTSYINMGSLLSSQNSALNIINTLSSLFSFILIIIIVYYLINLFDSVN
jgi:large-conductance mechanosensitive channel